MEPGRSQQDEGQHRDSSAQGGTRPLNDFTDFTAAIEQTMAVYTPLPNWSNQVFFISDGNPNEQNDPGGSSLTTSVSNQWNTFVDSNGINVTTIGVGDGINLERLQDVDLDGTGSPIMVEAFEDLVETLASQIVGGVVSGNVLLGSDNAVGGGDDDAFGAEVELHPLAGDKGIGLVEPGRHLALVHDRLPFASSSLASARASGQALTFVSVRTVGTNSIGFPGRRWLGRAGLDRAAIAADPSGAEDGRR